MTKLYKKNGAVFIPSEVTIDDFLEKEKLIKDLEQKIEIMKNCTNCRYGSDCQQNDNSECSRCLYGLNHCKNPKNKDNAYRDFEDVCEYWEIIR